MQATPSRSRLSVFPASILAVKLNRKMLAIVLETVIYVYDISNMSFGSVRGGGAQRERAGEDARQVVLFLLRNPRPVSHAASASACHGL